MGFLSRLFGQSPEPAPPRKDVLKTLADLAELRPGFPFELSAHAGDRVEGALLRLREEHAGRAVPVIVGTPDEAYWQIKRWKGALQLAEELKQADEMSMGQWFAQMESTTAPSVEEMLEDDGEPVDRRPITRLRVGQGPGQQPVAEVLIALVPATEATHLPAYLDTEWDLWPPKPHVHIALARHWKERHCAEIAVLTWNTIEYTVERPPETEAEAARLAIEQYLYCPGVLFGCTHGRDEHEVSHEGAGNLPALAQALRGSTRWHFCWNTM